MSDALASRIAELEAHVQLLEECERLNAAVDAQAEIALRDRLPLDHALRLWMPLLAHATHASTVFVRTIDESLSLHDYVHAEGEDDGLPFVPDAIVQAVHDAGTVQLPVRAGVAVAQRIDVAGEHFGTAAVVVGRSLSRSELHRIERLLDTWCEEIDNHLAAIADARKKTQITRAISDALNDPVLDRGLNRALEVLRTNVQLEDLVLVFRHEEDALGESLRYKVVRGGVLTHDSERDERDDAAELDVMKARAFRVLAGDDAEVHELLGPRRYSDEQLITGVRSAKVIGRLVVSAPRGELNTFDRDLLDRFIESLRQRIVDFNREWKTLKATFCKATVDQLLREDGYREKHLAPRERVCAVMFADISGFTRLSERVLVSPEAIGRFVDRWSEAVVDAVWESHGVFDKMVGDCVIAMWGPPFFELAPDDACARALATAERVREFTRSLVGHPDLPELAGLAAGELDVAIGLHFAPLFVGTFGPDQEYTGFSAGMNNTARLQGLARGGEILAMQSFVDALASRPALAERFGEARDAHVKNVEKPLVFRALG